MNWRAIFAIVRKDLKVVVQSKSVMGPLVILPLILLILLPGAAGLLLANTSPGSAAFVDLQQDMDTFMRNMPPSVAANVSGYDPVQTIAFLAFMYFFAPLFLILPVMTANVIAADSFVGEKERKTLEALIYTPTTDKELYVAKLLSPWITAIVVSLLGFIGYTIVVNATANGLMGGIFFPNLAWILLAVWVSPAAAGLGLGAMVLVSSRVSTFQEAYQLGGAVVLPVILLLLGQMAGVLYFDVTLVLILGVVLWLADAALFAVGARLFQRGELLARL